jgi:hypothetical protein
MPLKLVAGEHLKVMQTKPIVMPLDKWQDTAFFSQAAELAENSFARSDKRRKGWKGSIRGEKRRFIFGPNEVLIQVYPWEPTGPAVAFVFSKKVQGKELYAPFVIRLSPGVVGELRQAGRWPVMIDGPMVAA